MDDGMKQVMLTASATAYIKEEWLFQVPDGFDLTGDPAEVQERLLAALSGPVKLVKAETTDIWDEHDREWTDVITDPARLPAPPAPTTETIYTDAYGTTTEEIFQMARAANVSPSDYEEFVDLYGRTNYARIRAAINAGEHRR